MAYAWPDESVALLKRMHTEGWSCSRIALAINKADPDAGVSRNAVIGKLNRMGFVKPRPRNRLMNPPHKHKRAPNWFISPSRTPAPKFNPRPMPPMNDEPGPSAIPFSKRGKLQCSWIYGEPSADALCCGEPFEIGAPFSLCPTHCARATNTRAAAAYADKLLEKLSQEGRAR